LHTELSLNVLCAEATTEDSNTNSLQAYLSGKRLRKKVPFILFFALACKRHKIQSSIKTLKRFDPIQLLRDLQLFWALTD
jgi:hypothetical protein